MRARAVAFGLVCALAATLLSVVGCGGSTDTVATTANCPSSLPPQEYAACIAGEPAGEERPAAAEEDPEAGEEAAVEAAAGPLSYVGTATYSDNAGTTFKARFKVGRLHKASELTAPEGALSACNDNYSSGIASSVFAFGKATVTYEEGTLPYEFDVFGTGTGSLIPFKIDGAWECTGNGGIVTFESGETQTYPFWIVASGMLSNAEPNIKWAEVDTWSIGSETGGNAVSNGLTDLRVSGPGAVSCREPGGEGLVPGRIYELLLYGRPPIELPLLADGGSLPCKGV